MKKILVIEDDTSTRKLYRHFLERFRDIHVYEAGDGYTGLDQAVKIKPDLIILDNRMPGMPGELLAKKLKSIPSVKEIPIIMATAMKLTEELQEMIKMDIQEFIQQPFSQWELQKKIEKYLGPLIELTID